jgi:hypothetical protein
MFTDSDRQRLVEGYTVFSEGVEYGLELSHTGDCWQVWDLDEGCVVGEGKTNEEALDHAYQYQ